MANLLTSHCVRAINESDVGPVPGFEHPVLQVLAVKAIANNTAATTTTTNANSAAATNPVERYRVVLSDGTHYIQAMITTQLNGLIHSGDLAKGKLIRLNAYSISKMKEKK